MTTSKENFETIWNYCSSNRRVIPRDWQKVYDMLINRQSTAIRRMGATATPHTGRMAYNNADRETAPI